MNKEMKGWRMEGRPVLLPFDDDGNEDADACESRGIFFTQRQCIVCRFLLPVPLTQGRL